MYTYFHFALMSAFDDCDLVFHLSHVETAFLVWVQTCPIQKV